MNQARQEPATYLHCVGTDGRISEVSESWLRFAHDNDWPVEAEDVVGKKLWTFIDGEIVHYLYGIVMDKCRFMGRAVTMANRCDSPATRRYANMTIDFDPASETYQFTNTVVREQDREEEMRTTVTCDEDSHTLVLCSWCRRVDTGDSRWLEIEEARQGPAPLESGALRISHGACPDCMTQMLNMARQNRAILLVDDHEPMLEVLGVYLTSLGFTVKTASNGNAARQLYEKETFDLALVDIFMPERDGLETLRELKAMHPHTKVITLSDGFGPDIYAEISLDLGADASLRKPFDLAVLGRLVMETLPELETIAPD